jgi:uncharacterized circularly permuted ATP-grasp superfamily protein
MKGFGGVLALFTILILSVILLSSIYPIKTSDNTLIFIPEIKNFVSINELNLKNMASDCNWQKDEPTLKNCLQNGANLILNSTKTDPLISCNATILQKIDVNKYNMKLTCTNKILLAKNTNFDIKKNINLIAPKQ